MPSAPPLQPDQAVGEQCAARGTGDSPAERECSRFRARLAGIASALPGNADAGSHALLLAVTDHASTLPQKQRLIILVDLIASLPAPAGLVVAGRALHWMRALEVHNRLMLVQSIFPLSRTMALEDRTCLLHLLATCLNRLPTGNARAETLALLVYESGTLPPEKNAELLVSTSAALALLEPADRFQMHCQASDRLRLLPLAVQEEPACRLTAAIVCLAPELRLAAIEHLAGPAMSRRRFQALLQALPLLSGQCFDSAALLHRLGAHALALLTPLDQWNGLMALSAAAVKAFPLDQAAGTLAGLRALALRAEPEVQRRLEAGHCSLLCEQAQRLKKCMPDNPFSMQHLADFSSLVEIQRGIRGQTRMDGLHALMSVVQAAHAAGAGSAVELEALRTALTPEERQRFDQALATCAGLVQVPATVIPS